MPVLSWRRHTKPQEKMSPNLHANRTPKKNYSTRQLISPATQAITMEKHLFSMNVKNTLFTFRMAIGKTSNANHGVKSKSCGHLLSLPSSLKPFILSINLFSSCLHVLFSYFRPCDFPKRTVSFNYYPAVQAYFAWAKACSRSFSVG